MSVRAAKKTKKYDHYLDLIQSYLHAFYKIEVYFDRTCEDAYHHDGPEIHEYDYVTINKRRPKEWQVYALLHEAGHIILREQTEKYINRFPKAAHPTLTIARRIDTLREEVLAWERGKMLADELQIDVDPIKFHRQRTNALMKYSKWVVNPEEYE